MVVHAAVDGVALGAAATTTQTDVEMIVFIAIMLHKVYIISDILNKVSNGHGYYSVEAQILVKNEIFFTSQNWIGCD